MMSESVAVLDSAAVRARLPLVPVCGSLEDEQWAAFLDIEHLAESRGGLEIPWPAAIPESLDRGELFSQRVEALGEIGGHGAYARWLREHGIIRQCPPWCISTDHPRVAIWDPGRERVHVAYRADVPVAQSARRGGEAAYVEVFTFDDGPARIVVWDVEELTGGEARQLAAVLAEAADVLATIEGTTAGDC